MPDATVSALKYFPQFPGDIVLVIVMDLCHLGAILSCRVSTWWSAVPIRHYSVPWGAAVGCQDSAELATPTHCLGKQCSALLGMMSADAFQAPKPTLLFFQFSQSPLWDPFFQFLTLPFFLEGLNNNSWVQVRVCPSTFLVSSISCIIPYLKE